jgi:hypothetical protein
VDRKTDALTKLEVSDTVHLFSMDERKTNLMHLLYIFIVAVGDAPHVLGEHARNMWSISNGYNKYIQQLHQVGLSFIL